MKADLCDVCEWRKIDYDHMTIDDADNDVSGLVYAHKEYKACKTCRTAIFKFIKSRRLKRPA